jgi:hypothetical protein
MSNTKDDAVGYCRPPKHTRFKPGQSGNPRGRPKGRKNHATILAEAFNREITIREGDRIRKVTTFEAIVLKIITDAAKGNWRAIKLAFDYLARVGHLDPEPAEPPPSGVLIVPAPIDPESWAKVVAEQQAPYRGNVGKPSR